MQHWLLMDAHLRLLVQRFDQSIQALNEKLEEMRVTRPPFFQYKMRQLAVTEEHRVSAQSLSVQADARKVKAAMLQMDRIIVAKMSQLILALDPESALEADEILESTRRYARANWLDEEQNDQALSYILEQLAKTGEAPPEAPVVASVYGKDAHPKKAATNDPWNNAAD